MKRDMESLFKKRTAREMESNLLSKNHEMFSFQIIYFNYYDIIVKYVLVLTIPLCLDSWVNKD